VRPRTIGTKQKTTIEKLPEKQGPKPNDVLGVPFALTATTQDGGDTEETGHRDRDLRNCDESIRSVHGWLLLPRCRLTARG
jgi:hypothetical protein